MARDLEDSPAGLLRAVVACLSLALLAPAVAAHPGIEESLAGIDPSHLTGYAAARAYLERAELQRAEHQWAGASADFDRAESLAPGDPGVALGRAALLLDQGHAMACEGALDALVARGVLDPRVAELRARARAAQGRFLEAAADYDRWIGAIESPSPDAYVHRARWLEAAGSGAWDEALEGLEVGIARIGPVAGLVIEAAEIEGRLGRYADAGARLARFDAELTRIRLRRPAGPAATDPGIRRPPPRPERQYAPDPPGGGVSAPPLALTRGPYLQSGGPGRVVVRWRTNLQADGEVRYWPPPGTQHVTDTGVMTPDHEITLTGLSPGTQYAYVIGTHNYEGGKPLASGSFRTAPEPGTPGPTRVWILGDSGTADEGAMAVRDAFTAWNGVHPIDVWLMLGDNAYPMGSDENYQAAVFDMYPATLADHVLWPTRGNHDALYSEPEGDYYDIFTLPRAGECGGLPSGTEAYYSFDHANIHFVCLDSQGSDRSRSGPMMRWLESDLAASSQPWTLAFWHHPPYSKGSHDSDDPGDSGGRMGDMREGALGILDSAGVDLVLTGHSHSYERSFLVRGHYGTSNTLTPEMVVDPRNGRMGGGGPYHKLGEGPTPLDGVVYAVAGASGDARTGTLDHPVMVTSLMALGSMVIDVNGLRLDARYVNEHGAVLDSFTIFKGHDLAAPPGAAAPGEGEPAIGSIRPNPLLGMSRIAYTLPRAGRVRVRVIDAAGRQARLLVESDAAAGGHAVTWDGRDDAGARVAPGVYFAEVGIGGRRASARLVVLR